MSALATSRPTRIFSYIAESAKRGARRALGGSLVNSVVESVPRLEFSGKSERRHTISASTLNKDCRYIFGNQDDDDDRYFLVVSRLILRQTSIADV